MRHQLLAAALIALATNALTTNATAQTTTILGEDPPTSNIIGPNSPIFIGAPSGGFDSSAPAPYNFLDGTLGNLILNLQNNSGPGTFAGYNWDPNNGLTADIAGANDGDAADFTCTFDISELQLKSDQLVEAALRVAAAADIANFLVYGVTGHFENANGDNLGVFTPHNDILANGDVRFVNIDYTPHVPNVINDVAVMIINLSLQASSPGDGNLTSDPQLALQAPANYALTLQSLALTVPEPASALTLLSLAALTTTKRRRPTT